MTEHHAHHTDTRIRWASPESSPYLVATFFKLFLLISLHLAYSNDRPVLLAKAFWGVAMILGCHTYYCMYYVLPTVCHPTNPRPVQTPHCHALPLAS